MTALGMMRGVGAAAVVVVLATACGGGDSSGLASLAGTAPPAPTVDPEGIEPVSEPTAPEQLAPETTEAMESAASAAADPAGIDIDIDETGGASSTTGPEAGNGAGEQSTDPGNGTGEQSVVEDMTDEERMLAFAECMRDNGVEFPDPVVEADGTVIFGFRPGGGGGGGGGSQNLGEIGRDPDTPAARDACRGLMEGVAFRRGQGGFDLIELQDTLFEFAQCMRDNGVDVGDPDLGRFGPGGNDDDEPGGPFGAIDLDDPEFAAAFAVCQQQLPQGGGPRFGGGN